MSGISNEEILKFIKIHGGNLLKIEFLGVYPTDELKKLKSLKTKLTKEKHTVPCCIFNTDPIALPGEHWIGVFNISPDNELFVFDSFGNAGFSWFITNDDEQLLQPYFGFVDEETEDESNMSVDSSTEF